LIRRPPRSTPLYSSAASDVYKRQPSGLIYSTRKRSSAAENSPIRNKLVGRQLSGENPHRSPPRCVGTSDAPLGSCNSCLAVPTQQPATVAHAERRGRIRIISARKLTRNERRVYEETQR